MSAAHMHTPTPWHIDGVDDHLILSTDRRLEIGTCFDEVEGGAQDAAHIVRCVNAHDELVAALQALVDFAAADPHRAERCGGVIYHGRAALAKAMA